MPVPGRRTRGRRGPGLLAGATRPASWAALALLVLAAALAWRACGGGWGAPGPGSGGVVLSQQSAERLSGLPVREKGGPEYSREEFGPAWADVDRNGCDTRNDVLARDLSEAQRGRGERCEVARGVLEDPYTGRRMDFERGKTSRDVHIDHVVALSDAWASGAHAWDRPARQAMANDPANLLAVEGRANTDKGASDAADWLPPRREYRCAYVGRQILVKSVYGLSVTEAERDAMLGALADCPGYELGE